MREADEMTIQFRDQRMYRLAVIEEARPGRARDFFR